MAFDYASTRNGTRRSRDDSPLHGFIPPTSSWPHSNPAHHRPTPSQPIYSAQPYQVQEGMTSEAPFNQSQPPTLYPYGAPPDNQYNHFQNQEPHTPFYPPAHEPQPFQLPHNEQPYRSDTPHDLLLRPPEHAFPAATMPTPRRRKKEARNHSSSRNSFTRSTPTRTHKHKSRNQSLDVFDLPHTEPGVVLAHPPQSNTVPPAPPPFPSHVIAQPGPSTRDRKHHAHGRSQVSYPSAGGLPPFLPSDPSPPIILPPSAPSRRHRKHAHDLSPAPHPSAGVSPQPQPSYPSSTIFLPTSSHSQGRKKHARDRSSASHPSVGALPPTQSSLYPNPAIIHPPPLPSRRHRHKSRDRPSASHPFVHFSSPPQPPYPDPTILLPHSSYYRETDHRGRKHHRHRSPVPIPPGRVIVPAESSRSRGRKDNVRDRSRSRAAPVSEQVKELPTSHHHHHHGHGHVDLTQQPSPAPPVVLASSPQDSRGQPPLARYEKDAIDRSPIIVQGEPTRKRTPLMQSFSALRNRKADASSKAQFNVPDSSTNNKRPFFKQLFNFTD